MPFRVMKRGKLIVIDGTDGSGKGTQTRLLIERLKSEGYSVELADFPQYGKRSATMVEDYLNGKFGSAKKVGPYRASIFYAADRFEASFQMREWLKEGKIIISNRYVSSSMGHQAGKIKDKKRRKRFMKWLLQLEYDIFQIPKPDKTILLYMPVEVGQKLVDKKGQRKYLGDKKRDIHEEDLNHLKDAAKSYLGIVKKYKWTTIDCAPKGTMESLRSVEDINNELYSIIKKII